MDDISTYMFEQNEQKILTSASELSIYTLSQPISCSNVLLSCACQLTMHKLVIYLIKKGVNIDGIYTEGKSKHSPISQLVHFRHNSIVFKSVFNFFLLNGANVDNCGSNFKSLLYEMIYNTTSINFVEQFRLITFILEKGSNPNINYYFHPGICVLENNRINKSQKKKLLVLLILYGLDISTFTINKCNLFKKILEEEIEFTYQDYISEDIILNKMKKYLYNDKTNTINTSYLSGNNCNKYQSVILNNKWAFHLSEIKYIIKTRKNPYTMETISKNKIKKLLKNMDNLQEITIEELLNNFHILIYKNKEYIFTDDIIHEHAVFLQNSIDFYLQLHYPYISVSSIQPYSYNKWKYLMRLLGYRYSSIDFTIIDMYLIIIDLYTIKNIFSKNNFEISFLINTYIEHMQIIDEIKKIIDPIYNVIISEYGKLPWFDIFKDFCFKNNYDSIFHSIYSICNNDDYYLNTRLCWNELVIPYYI